MNDLTYTRGAAVASEDVAEFAGRVYGWVGAGLFVSGFTAWAINSDPSRLASAQNHFLLWALVPFVPLLVLASGARRMSPALATLVYVAFCALEGIGLGVIVSYYSTGSVTLALASTAALFTGMAVVGTVVKADLTRFGGLLIAALVGLILASLVNLFFASSTVTWLITYAGVLIFLGLTAYDAQRVKAQAQTGDTSQGAALMLAVSLYLDALNLFLFMLRIFGGRD